MSFRPIFVLGIARSGTNLLARMLDRHPQIAVALDPFMPLFKAIRNAVVLTSAPEAVRRRFDPDAPFQDYYFHPDGPAMLDALIEGDARAPIGDAELAELRRTCAERAALESPTLGERMARLSGASYAELIFDGLRIVGETRPDAVWVGCKEVWVYDFVPLLARAFPQARFYAIERDPRAVVASLVALAQRDPGQAAHAPSYMRHWRKSVALARRFEADPYLRQRFRSISYERIAVDPEAEARGLCGELDVPFTSAMLELSAEGWRGNSSYGDGRGIYTGSAERWRTDLPTEAVRTVDFMCAPEMRLTAYSPGSDVALDSAILRYMDRASSRPGSWRSDSGDPVVDIGGEVLRHALLAAFGPVDPRVVRRCFLFTETFDAIARPRETRDDSKQPASTS
jgi:hypothetical protein